MAIRSILLFVAISCLTSVKAQKRLEFYEIVVYHFNNARQESLIDEYLKNSFLPHLHHSGSKAVGVFKPIANDTATIKRIYVLIPLRAFGDALAITPASKAIASLGSQSRQYGGAQYNEPPYLRMETILLQAFELNPRMSVPALSSARNEHIYELRSYESPTESLYRNKVKMFNQGGEIALFRRLGFNAVFYAEVIAGSRMPNLMYMTSFENMKARDDHWKAFGQDPEWQKLSSMEEYQHNVSRAEIILMRATEYSDY